jgi:acetyl esterase/lipase
MTLDEAMAEASSEHTYDEIREFGCEWTRLETHIEAHRLLAKEVERLRDVVKTQDAQHANERAVHAKVEAQAREEVERLRAQNEAMEIQAELGITQCKCGRVSMVDAEVERLRSESAAMRAVVEALRTSVEQRSAQLQNAGKGGQHVGDFGEFASMGPSAISRLRWYLREFDRTKSGADK